MQPVSWRPPHEDKIEKLNTHKNSVCPLKNWQMLLEHWENAKLKLKCIKISRFLSCEIKMHQKYSFTVNDDDDDDNDQKPILPT